jgi:hypothetical protein
LQQEQFETRFTCMTVVPPKGATVIEHG